MRGAYSAGALAAMEDVGLSHVFDSVYAESAGATNACYFLAEQASYGPRIYTEDLASRRFFNPLRVGRTLDIEYAIDVVVKRVKPLNVQKVLASASDLYVAVTSATTGASRLLDVRVPLLTPSKPLPQSCRFLMERLW